MRRYFILLIIGCLLLGFGIIYTIIEALQFTYIDQSPDVEARYEEVIKNYSFKGKPLHIRMITSDYAIDENEELDGEIIVRISYYPELIKLKERTSSYHNHNVVRIGFSSRYNQIFYKEIVGLIKENLKNKTIYNYKDLLEPSIIIEVHPDDVDKLKILSF